MQYHLLFHSFIATQKKSRRPQVKPTHSVNFKAFFLLPLWPFFATNQR